ncbi:MAG: hypothetical protein CL908_09410 [Deltaproteobacteria bacterium]|nr:hypothetical protein [Deltaproteobacteria bacterium]
MPGRHSRHGPADRLIARLLVVAIATMSSFPVSAGEELQDANETTYDASVVSLDNSLAGETTFTIDATQTEIGWQDLQQPRNNTLEFDFVDPSPNSVVLNRIGANRPPTIGGTVLSNGTVAFSSPFGLFVGSEAVIDVGTLVAVGADVSREAFFGSQRLGLELTGEIENRGTILAEHNVALLGRQVSNSGEIRASLGHVLMLGGERLIAPDWDSITGDFLANKQFFGILGDGRVDNAGRIDAPNAALISGHVENLGEIEIADGSLLMVGADAVYLSRFDDPVFVRLPYRVINAGAATDDGTRAAEYAIENHGTIDAGIGHVRLAAADPLGFGIRQGTGSGSTSSIRAQEIELEGGEIGRVHLSGTIDAQDHDEVGGEISVSGTMIVLEDATLTASGREGGGQIHIGGEQQGGGDLQRARTVVIDESSSVRANAITRGNGGEVIVFAEEFTSIDGELEAKGGHKRGDGGFIETSGLRSFAIRRAPDVSARNGLGGSWLIDPYDILIQSPGAGNPNDCNACLNNAIQAILDPDFDDAAFDGILRTVDPGDNLIGTNEIDPVLIARALAIGTDVTLSTQAFGVDNDPDGGDITIVDAIVIDSDEALVGTTAKLTLLAAGGITVDSDIRVDPDSSSAMRRRVALDVELRANDLTQEDPNIDFNANLVDGDVAINADIMTGGGDISASGIAVVLASGSTIHTEGGDVVFSSGTLEGTGTGFLSPVFVVRQSSDPSLQDLYDAGTTSLDPRIDIAGDIDTSVSPGSPGNRETGGRVTMNASSINVTRRLDGRDPLEIITGQFLMSGTGSITTDGGDVDLAGGIENMDGSQTNFVGDIDLQGGSVDSGGGDVRVLANRLDEEGDAGSYEQTFIDPARSQGGEIALEASIVTSGGTLEIGGDRTRSIALDGTFDTTQASEPTENGLIRILALDGSDPNSAGVGEDGLASEASVVIGGDDSAVTTLRTAGLSISSRDVTTSTVGAANGVRILLEGSSTAGTSEDSTSTDPSDDPSEELTAIATSEQVDITARRQITFNQNTAITGETIAILAASDPLELADLERPDGEVRSRFGGSNDGVASDLGVRLNADIVSITIGDDTTATSDLFSEDPGTLAMPTDFGIQRNTTGSYEGLQLRDLAGTDRPEELSIRQDGDLTVRGVAATGAGELYLAGAFGAAAIGANGMQTTLSSSDGILTVEDSAPFDRGTPGVGDAGKSWVVLNGGLFLPDDDLTPPPGLDRNSVVFGGGVAFDVDGLTLSTPGEYTVDDAIAAAFGTADELVIEAGRSTDLDDTAGRGTLTIGTGTGFELRAMDRLALLAGASGFGDLVFATATTLASNEIELRAGAGNASENSEEATRSSIQGVQANVDFTDGRPGINDFGGAGSTATSFSYRQDAAIDGQADLPDLAQLLDVPASGFQTDVDYQIWSDTGGIDLDDGMAGTNEGDRFANAALTLVGFESADLPAIEVSDDFAVTGPRVLLGGIDDFTFDQQLASAFNRADDSLEQFTLRAGLGERGRLLFDRGIESSVQIKADRIDLVAGDGPGEGFNSSIHASDAEFVLTGERAFSWQTDGQIRVRDLPDESQFVAGVLPRILAIRGSGTEIDFDDFDPSELPIDTTTPDARLILEADSITLAQDDGDDLELTTDPNLNIRLRANKLSLIAFRPSGEGGEGRVLAGPRAGESLSLAPGSDASFDSRSLLIEGFDDDADIDLATTGNLSTLSEDPDNPGIFDLSLGRAPTSMGVTQDGIVSEDQLPDYRSVSGLFASTIDDDDDLPIPTSYFIQSLENPATIKAENVENSSLIVFGRSPDTDFPNTTALTFLTGDYSVDDLFATTNASILIANGVSITATDSITLEAGTLSANGRQVVTESGNLVFGEGPGPITPTITLQADSVLLSAGPTFEVTDPDSDGDDERDPIADAIASKIDFSGLDRIVRNTNATDSLFLVRQSASLDTSSVEGDFLKAFGDPAVDLGADKWEDFDISSVQGNLIFNSGDLEGIALKTTDFSAGALAEGSRLAVEVPLTDEVVRDTASFSVFDGEVVLTSSELTLETTEATAALDLDSDNFQLVSTDRLTGFESEDERFRLLSDPDVLDRPIVRIRQIRDFADATLPGGDRYFQAIPVGDPIQRTDLSLLDIVLETSGSLLTFDDTLRDRVSGSNLSLVSTAGDIDIAIGSRTPGFENLDEYADLQLASFDVDANGGAGTITFSSAPSVEGLSIETLGDQHFNGQVELGTSLSTEGRDIAIRNDITRSGSPDIGLSVATTGKAIFGGDIGSPSDPLAHLHLAFDSDQSTRTPSAEFGLRQDIDGDGIDETPIDSDQQVFTRDEILFYAFEFGTSMSPSDLSSAGRRRAVPFASVGKALGDLTFTITDGDFEVARGERISVGGALTIDVDDGDVVIGDISAIALTVIADSVGLLRRSSGVSNDLTGETQPDAGPAIVTNALVFRDTAFNDLTPTVVGRGRDPRFGFPSIADSALPNWNRAFSFFEIKPSGQPLTASDFVFASADEQLLVQVPSWVPKGASRSDLSGASGPRVLPTPTRTIREPLTLAHPERLLALAVDARKTTHEVIRARLEGVAVIDDLALSADEEFATVTDARLDAKDAELAIELYEELFGPDGLRANEVREVLQNALDSYLETTRARRVVGFELRRFVKNRPSSLLEAYGTLESLDSLFRYHRRLGLSPGEFRRIQRSWLVAIQPDGIPLDELAETIHPSRYVRGSDILDIFGR